MGARMRFESVCNPEPQEASSGSPESRYSNSLGEEITKLHPGLCCGAPSTGHHCEIQQWQLLNIKLIFLKKK